MKDLTYLINPSEKGILQTAGDRMPLGLLYMAETLRRHNHPVKVFDLNHDSIYNLVRNVVTDKPSMIGVSCLTSPMVNESKSLIKELKKVSDYTTRFVVGGYHPSIMPADFLDIVDNVVIGEGEYALECLVNGIKDEPIIINGKTNLEGLLPARDLLDPNNYNMDMHGLRGSTMITSRGCPNECVFCGNQRSKVRKHDLKSVNQELSQIKNQGYKAVYFLDDVFTIDKERAKQIGRLANNKGLKWRATTRANYLDEDLINSFAQNGCEMVSMGIESGNDQILRNIGKNQTKSDIIKAQKLLNKYNIPSKGFYVIGLPGETPLTATETYMFSKDLQDLGMEKADFYPLIPYPGTPIWTNPEKFDIKILDRNYTNYLQASSHELKIPCETKGMKADEIGEAIKEYKQRWLTN